jgi:hypothetical protein
MTFIIKKVSYLKKEEGTEILRRAEIMQLEFMA